MQLHLCDCSRCTQQMDYCQTRNTIEIWIKLVSVGRGINYYRFLKSLEEHKFFKSELVTTHKAIQIKKFIN